MSKSKREEMRQKRIRQQRNQRLMVIGLVAIGVLFIAAAIIYPQIKPIGTVVTAEPFSRPTVSGNGTGDPNAPVLIEVFSDFQCPYCARFSESTEKQLIDAFVATGKVYYRYRSMGNFLSNNLGVGTESQDSAAAAYCAGDQNKFWEYHDTLFANQTGEGVGDFAPRKLTAYAEALGLDVKAFQDCFDSGKYRDQVKQDGVDGANAGVTGTPSFLLSWTVNGQTKQKLIVGAEQIGTFQQEIEAALAEMGQ